jgi:hypothetical protein
MAVTPPTKAPAITLTYDPAGPQFLIGKDAIMPKITVTATLQNVTPDPKVTLTYVWKISLIYKGTNCMHSRNRQTSHTPINQTTTVNKLTIPFAQVRGGDLSIEVSVVVGAVTVKGQSTGLSVGGQDPTFALLAAAAPPLAEFRKIMQQETQLHQFVAPDCPKFNETGDGGVGICQITGSATDDDVWNWKMNLAKGWELFKTKQKEAKQSVKNYRTGKEFEKLVKAYNDLRLAQNNPPKPAPGAPPPPPPPNPPLKALTVELPEYSDDQMMREVIRYNNGWGAPNLHEFSPKLDKDGILVVTVDSTGTKGTAEWKENSAADRDAFFKAAGLSKTPGDRDYVENVLRQSGF